MISDIPTGDVRQGETRSGSSHDKKILSKLEEQVVCATALRALRYYTKKKRDFIWSALLDIFSWSIRNLLRTQYSEYSVQ
jgi:hypothetical protein